MDPLWADLINSDWHDYRGSGAREDRISNDVWLRRFLARSGWAGDPLPDARGRESLRRLRGLLRRVVNTVRSGRQPSPADLKTLNRTLGAAPLMRRIARGPAGAEVVLEPVAVGIDLVMGEVVASFAAMLAQGEPSRIKICANPDCGWVMYDSSRNQTRRWCDKKDCGNLIKVRRHRRKKRESAP